MVQHSIRWLAPLLGATLLSAADAPAAAPQPLPPLWPRAIGVTVLTGADVAGGAEAQAFPATLMLKVSQPEKLPVSLAKGQTDCLFEAQGWANLSAERALIQLQYLRCYDSTGQEVLTRAVRGFALDRDNRAGIKSTLLWGQTAKDLLLLGVGAQVKQNFLLRATKSALGKASLGLTDSLVDGDDDKKQAFSADGVRELRSSETLMPVLTLEPGREFGVVLHGGKQPS